MTKKEREAVLESIRQGSSLREAAFAQRLDAADVVAMFESDERFRADCRHSRAFWKSFCRQQLSVDPRNAASWRILLEMHDDALDGADAEYARPVVELDISDPKVRRINKQVLELLAQLPISEASL